MCKVIYSTRRVKTRKEHICSYCQKMIPVKSIAYREKVFEIEDDSVYSEHWYSCSRCKYKSDQHNKRLAAFKPHCHHPARVDQYSYIPGECVMQPDHIECLVCGAHL